MSPDEVALQSGLVRGGLEASHGSSRLKFLVALFGVDSAIGRVIVRDFGLEAVDEFVPSTHSERFRKGGVMQGRVDLRRDRCCTKEGTGGRDGCFRYMCAGGI